MKAQDLDGLLADVRACRTCEAELPLGPRPIVRLKPGAQILIIGQAPGTKVHASGVPWNDPSGDRLRAWLDIDRDTFYDESRIAIIPMGFCYPGRAKNGGDRPPRPECAPLWHQRLLTHLPQLSLTLLVGTYAQRYYLGKEGARTMTETVAGWRAHWPRLMPLPHPSWRTRGWVKRNPWYEREILPALRVRVRSLL